MKEAAATNGPELTVSKKTQVSLELLEQGMARLQNNLKSINEDYLGDVDLPTLLTTKVENLHAVSHFKKPDFHSFKVCSRLWQNCKRIIKKNNQVERQILYT